MDLNFAAIYKEGVIDHNLIVISYIRSVISSRMIRLRNNTLVSIKGFKHIMSALENICTKVEEVNNRLRTVSLPVLDRAVFYSFLQSFCAVPVISKNGYLLDSCKYLFIKADPRLNVDLYELSILHGYIATLQFQTGGDYASSILFDFSSLDEDFTNLDLTEDPSGEDTHLYRYTIPSYVKNEIYKQLQVIHIGKSRDELAYLTEDITTGYGHLLDFIGKSSYDSELIAKAIQWHQMDRFSSITYSEFEKLFFDRLWLVNKTRVGERQFPFLKYNELYMHILMGTPYVKEINESSYLLHDVVHYPIMQTAGNPSIF